MKNLKGRFVILFLLLTSLSSLNAIALEVINIKPIADDMTPIVRSLIAATKDKDIKLVFEAGNYKFLPNLAKERYCYITNHENGLKRIIFDFQNFNSVQIEGNGAKFIFHGLSATFIFSFIMMYFIHPNYAFYSVCLAPFIFVLSYYFFKKEIDGYYISRNFYSPTPEQVQLDLDNTLGLSFWDHQYLKDWNLLLFLLFVFYHYHCM